MTLEKILFYVFSAIVLASAALVVTSRNPVRAVLFLVLAFVGASGLWILLQAEFLGIILILVYVGAVMVLFLFVVMMLDVEVAAMQHRFVSYLPFALLIAVLLLVQFVWVLGPERFGLDAYQTPELLPADYSNTKALGYVIFTQYIVAFEVAGVLLLTAMIAAVSLTFRGVRQRKAQAISEQLKATKENRLKVVKMTNTNGG